MKIGDKVQHINDESIVGDVVYLDENKITILVDKYTGEKRTFIKPEYFKVIKTKEEIAKEKRRESLKRNHEYIYDTINDNEYQKSNKKDIGDDINIFDTSDNENINNAIVENKQMLLNAPELQLDDASINAFWESFIATIDPRRNFELVHLARLKKDIKHTQIEAVINSYAARNHSPYEKMNKDDMRKQLAELFFNSIIQSEIDVYVNYEKKFTAYYENGKHISSGKIERGDNALITNILRGLSKNIDFMQNIINDKSKAINALKFQIEEIEKNKEDFEGTDVQYAEIKRKTDKLLRNVYVYTVCRLKVLTNNKVYYKESKEE